MVLQDLVVVQAQVVLVLVHVLAQVQVVQVVLQVLLLVELKQKQSKFHRLLHIYMFNIYFYVEFLNTNLFYSYYIILI